MYLSLRRRRRQRKIILIVHQIEQLVSCRGLAKLVEINVAQVLHNVPHTCILSLSAQVNVNHVVVGLLAGISRALSAPSLIPLREQV